MLGAGLCSPSSLRECTSTYTTSGPRSCSHPCYSNTRFPDSVLGAVVDRLERLYLAGLPILQLFVSIYGGLPSPESDQITTAASFIIQNVTALGQNASDTFVSSRQTAFETLPSTASSNMEFLPLMLTSVYCAIGLLWAFARLSWMYTFRTSSTTR